MWKNTFNFAGDTPKKDYWLALIMNTVFMYVLVIPYALILRNFPVSPIAASVVLIVLANVPALALYFRRANDTNWKKSTTLLMALVCPIISGLFVGLLPSLPKGQRWPRSRSIPYMLFGISYGLFFYSSVMGLILYGDPIAVPWLAYAGLILGAVTLIGVGVKMFTSKE